MALSEVGLLKRDIRLGGGWVSLELAPAFSQAVAFLFPPGDDRPGPSGSTGPAARYVLTATGSGSGTALVREGITILSVSSVEAAAVHLVDRISYDVVDAVHDGLVLHAALVAKGGRGLILPAASGSGKSTLAAWLVRRGFDYGSDELAYTPFDSSVFYPFERPINLKQQARERTNAIFGFSADLYRDPQRCLPSPPVDFIASGAFGPGRIHGGVNIAAVVFPRFTPERGFKLQPVSKGRAGLEWMRHLLNARNLPGHGFSEMSRLARVLPAYLLEYDSFDQLGAVFEELVTGGA